MFDDFFSSVGDFFSSGDTGGGYEVAEAFGGPQEDVVFQEFSQTGTLPAWEEARGAAIVQETLGQQIVSASLSEFRDAQTVDAALSSAGSDYAERLALDLARIGASVAGSALNSGATAARQTIQTGAAMITPRLPATRTLFDKNAITNQGFGAGEVLIGGLLLIGGAYAVAKLA